MLNSIACCNSSKHYQQTTLDLNTSQLVGRQQYVPDLMEQEAEVFGNENYYQDFLAQVGAEEAMSADQVIWSEQGRLHLSYVCKTASTTTILIQGDIDENNYNATWYRDWCRRNSRC
jgi:hypothetical protein